ncbi:heavy metal translocating P-type ATPase [Conexibacter sp. W3-3-2]|uniref:heavy metal translocating P-type ATPase n=1 Tax=Conexibacter sp. W3-3-2 TaxID=2675227 RepID=UPI00132108AC|nr:heavy metal translocating P-type ATPase [Conexibacter sp. W3-3-2]MTD46307.1 heavy metal translocating P-type ATPase [Conexibacter sp. W3-3-2]
MSATLGTEPILDAADRAPRGEHDGHDHDGLLDVFGARTEIAFSLLAGAAVLTGWILETVADVEGAVPTVLFLAAYVFGGSLTLREAYQSVRAGRFEIDFLMLVAAVGAAALGKFFEGGLLLFLFSLGHSLEHYAMGRAKRAIEALAELAPKTALVRRDGAELEVAVEALAVGDTVIVRPNSRIPADGFVLDGTSSVDQAPITGESVPVDKQPVEDRTHAAQASDSLDASNRVFAGTINGTGALDIYVTRRAADNTLARVVQLVSEAETGQSPTQQFTNRFERYFVPAVILFVLGLTVSPVFTGEDFGDSFYRAMAVLVAASPCALAIATPSAVLSAVARAGRSGVLVKGGGPLEDLGQLQSIAFDKTGTVTEGKPRLTDVVAGDGIPEARLLRAAVAVERLSDHPLARAIVRDGVPRLAEEPATATELQSIIGRGVRASLDDQTIHVGKLALFAEIDGAAPPTTIVAAVETLETAGRTTMVVRHGDEYLGVIGVMDTARAGVAEVVHDLRQLGVRRMVMLSGDNQRVANAIAGEVGLDDARGDLMPADKVTEITALRAQGTVGMVGDGVNDAPALASATVGIAMGAAGSDVALETADIALMGDDLRRLPFAVGLGRTTNAIIRQNLIVSLGIVAILIPATLLGLGIGPAVFVHEGSTLLVVGNALRLLAYRETT